ncbi:MAG TPA: YtxH domain-containing protein [Thermoanaerobaculia bacterium]|jgi:gas vesicle protein|nr:YtxH domain-containing protein [Thermoanaerobaculia bacterium]
MTTTTKSNFPAFLFTFIGGALAGAAVALLYAPMSGRRLQRKVADVADKVVDTVDDLQDRVRRLTSV